MAIHYSVVLQLQQNCIQQAPILFRQRQLPIQLFTVIKEPTPTNLDLLLSLSIIIIHCLSPPLTFAGLSQLFSSFDFRHAHYRRMTFSHGLLKHLLTLGKPCFFCFCFLRVLFWFRFCVLFSLFTFTFTNLETVGPIRSRQIPDLDLDLESSKLLLYYSTGYCIGYIIKILYIERQPLHYCRLHQN